MSDEPDNPVRAEEAEPIADAIPAEPRAPDPLRDVLKLRRAVRVGVYTAITVDLPFYYFALGYSFSQTAGVGIIGWIIALVAVEMAFRQMIKLRKRSAYPNVLLVEMGVVGDTALAAQRGLDVIVRLLGVRAALIGLRGRDGRLRLAACRGLSDSRADEILMRSRDAAGDAMAQLQPVSVKLAAGEPFHEAFGLAPDGVNRIVFAPVIALQNAIGVIVLASDSRDADLNDDQLMSGIGIALGLSLENLRQRDELRDGQERLERVVTGAPLVLFALDRDGAYTLVEGRGLEVLGTRPEQVLGRSIFDIFKGRTEITDAVKRALAGEEVIASARFSGAVFESRLTPVRDAGGGVAGVIGVAMDVTECRQAEDALHASQEQLSTMVANVPVVLFAIDRDGNFTLSEGKGLAALGLKAGQVVGLNVRDVYGGDHPEITGNIERALGGEVVADTVEVNGLFWETIYSPVRDASGAVTGLIGVAANVTERRLADEALRDSEERYRALVENASDGIFAIGMDNRFISVNAAAAVILGYDPEELIGRDVNEVIAPEHRNLADTMTARKLESGGQTAYEILAIRKDGSFVPLEISSWLAYEDGKPVAIHGIARDVSERRQSEEAVQRRDAILEAVGFAAGRFLSDSDYREGMPDVLDRLGRTTGVSRVYVFENHTGGSGEQLTSQRFEWAGDGVAPQIDNPELQELPYREAGFARWEEMLAAGQPVFGLIKDFPPCEREVLDPQGILSLAVVPIFAGGAWWGLIGFDDCAEPREWSPAEIEALWVAGQLIGAAIQRMRAEQAVRESEERYRELFDNAADIVYTHDLMGRFTSVNEAAERITGYSREEAIGMNIAVIVAPDHLQNAVDMIRKKVQGGGDQTTYGIDIITKDGRRVTLEVSTRLILEDGKPVGVQGIARDINERKRAEEALRESEEKYRDLVENSNEIIYTLDASGTITYISPAVRQLGGYEPEEVVGKTSLSFVHPEDLPELAASFQRTIGGSPEPSEYRLRGKSGEYVWVRTSSKLIYDGDKIAGLRGLIVDIDQRKRAEEARQESEARYHSVFEAARDVIYTLSTDGKFTSLNRAFEQITGWSREEWLGKSFSSLLHPDDVPSVAERIQKLLSGESADQEPQERRVRTKSGDYVTGEFIPTPLYESGKLVGILGIGRDVSERKRIDAALRAIVKETAAEAGGEFFRSLVQHLADVVGAKYAFLGRLADQDKVAMLAVWAGEGFAENFEYALKGTPCENVVDREVCVYERDVQGWFPDDLALVEMGAESYMGAPLFDSAGRALGLLAVMDDKPMEPSESLRSILSIFAARAGAELERNQAEEALQASEERYRNLVDTAQDVIYTLGLDASLTSLNPAFETVTGWKRKDWLGKNFAPLVHPDDLNTAVDMFKRVLAGENPSYELRIRRPDGEYVVGEFTSTPLMEDGELRGAFGIARDITERKKAEMTIRQLAYHDGLTGLPNRALFEDRLGVALAQAHRSRQMLAVMFLDLDRFKTVNDTLGHSGGDKLLKGVAEDLKTIIREGDTVARVGGDEFTLLLPGIESQEDATEVAQRILDVLRGGRLVDSQEFSVSTSIGITLYPQDGADTDTLLRNADTAMYRAKESGRDNYQLYTPAMNAGVLQRLSLENDLRHALERNELRVYFQPISETATGRIVATEALVRWEHPQRGIVAPDEFIPFAEETGLIVPIGEWVLGEAMRQNQAWQEAGYRGLRVAVNMSARQLQQDDLASTVSRLLRETGLAPELLQLEITEGAVMKNVELIIAMLQQIRRMGISISLDDFGTGYSSLSYLKRFPIDSVKIDRSFVRDIATDPNDAAIVTTVITMAGSLNLQVIAEGVETNEQLEFLRQRGCGQFQGYLVSPPAPADVITRLLEPARRTRAKITRLKTA